MESLLIGLVSISDRASSGVYEDKGIPGLNEWFTAALSFVRPWHRSGGKCSGRGQAKILKGYRLL